MASKSFNQLSPRIVASRKNGKRGGEVTAQRYSKEIRSTWGEKAGSACLERHGREYYRHIRARRTHKQQEKKGLILALASA